MRPSVRLLPFAILVVTGCVQHASLLPIEPSRVDMAGDTVRFGNVVTAIEPAGRFVQLSLREHATVVFVRYSAITGTRLLEARELDPGSHRVSTQRFGGSCARRCAPARGTPQMRGAYEALLVVVMPTEFERHRMVGVDFRVANWGGPVKLQRMRDAEVALHELPPSLVPEGRAWAAYLVELP